MCVHTYAQLPYYYETQKMAKHAVEVDVRRVCEGELVHYAHDPN